MAKSNIPELVPFGNFILKKYGVDAVVTAEDLAAFDATGEPEAAVVEESKPLSDHSQDEGSKTSLNDPNGATFETANGLDSIKSEDVG